MDHTWIIGDAAPNDFHQAHLNLPPLVRQVLWRRGVQSAAELEQFLQPAYDQLGDPFQFQQMDTAVETIIHAIADQRQITIYGDYDADGVTSTALMVETLEALGAKVNWYLPERLAEGYGLRTETVAQLADQGTQLLVTVDCGTTNVAEISLARQRGLDVIVIDHHHQPAELPPATAIINPVFEDERYPARTLSSAGVAFTVARGLLARTQYGRTLNHELPVGWEKWLLDLVAISTVADMMPLRGENRILVRYGLQVLRKSRRPGLRALFAVMGTQIEQADEFTVGFQIGPRINAAGRLHHASLALHLLLTKQPDEARDLANQLQAINLDRQKLTELAVAEALEQIQAAGEQSAYVAFASHWSPGILGLVAGRLAERVWRPVLVMTENDGQIVGSGRSIPGYDIMQAMDAGREHFLRFGGHPGACGFTLAKAEGRSDFHQWFQEFISRDLKEVKMEKPLHVDGRARLADFSDEALDVLAELGPYGIENTRPTFLIEQADVQSIALAGAQRQHLRLGIQQDGVTVRCIGFRQGARGAELVPGQHLDVVVEASWNVWRERKEPQFKIIDLRRS
ncbi:MAG: single-stranded-DNA-specific exonuclease RecJ [Candidatus Kerfeldbacteria bacterium]|nr:single-stranded-DNA-specific exonuclease RecJ [Candidatus Kerfeldbacteria bacterium]